MQATTRQITPMPGTIEETAPHLSADDQMVLAAQADRSQFAALYTKYHDQLARFIYQRMGSREEALDMTQQVFLQAMIALDRYEPRGFPFSSWLYRIALNEINTRYRKTKNQRTINIDDAGMVGMMDELQEPYSEEREEMLLAAMQHLEEDDVQVLEMRFFEKRPFKEIAEIRDSNESAVKMKVYRLLDKLKGIMDRK